MGGARRSRVNDVHHLPGFGELVAEGGRSDIAAVQRCLRRLDMGELAGVENAVVQDFWEIEGVADDAVSSGRRPGGDGGGRHAGDGRENAAGVPEPFSFCSDPKYVRCQIGPHQIWP